MVKKAAPFLSAPTYLAFFGFTLIGIGGGANGVLIPSLSAFYHIGSAVIGLLFLVSSLGYFLAALSCGLLTKKFGLRWLLVVGAIALFLGESGFGLKLPFVVLLFARLLIGLGIGILETGFNIFVTTLPRHTVLLNYLHAFYGAGALLGPLIASAMLALSWDWSYVYLLLVGLSLPLIFGISILLDKPQPGPTVSESEMPPKEQVPGMAIKLPVVWIGAAFLLIYVGVEVSLGNWGFTFLLEARQQGTVLAGWIISGFWLGLTLGRFTLQALAERFGIGTRELMYACIIGTLIGLLLIWLVPLSITAGLGFCFIGFCIAPIYPLTVAIVPKLVPAHLSPSAIGLLVSTSIIGLALFPWFAGILAQILGIWTLIPYTLGLTIVMGAIWVYLAPKTVKTD